MMTPESFVYSLCDDLWYFTFIFLVGFGLYYTFRFKGLLFRSIPDMIRSVRSGENNDRSLSSFETFCVSMGSRIGVGNIAGIAVAIITGGPGTIFWMWIFALIGSMTAFYENIMSQLYKEDMKNGGFFGGPAYCAKNALGNRKLGLAISFLTIIMFVIGFSGVDTACAVSVVAGEIRFENDWWIVPLVCSVSSILITSRGTRLAAKASTLLVPFMTILWLALSIFLLAINIDGVVMAFFMIFEYAFSVPAALGGTLGSIIIVGLRRGIFANEAGLGTVSNLTGSAYVRHPVNQGFVQAFGVWIDTLVLCTITALVILSYGTFDDIMGLGLTDMQLVQYIAMDTPLGIYGHHLVTICALFFVFTGMISGIMISTSCLRFISDSNRLAMMMPIVYATGGFIMGIGNVTTVFTVCDIIMAVVTFLNIYIMIRIRGTVVAVVKDWCEQRKTTREPVFDSSTVPGCENVKTWMKES